MSQGGMSGDNSVAVLHSGANDEDMVQSSSKRFPASDPLGLESIIRDEQEAKLLVDNQDRSQSLSYSYKDGLHTFAVPVKASDATSDGSAILLNAVSFELAPVSVIDKDGTITQEFTIVPAGQLPVAAPSNSETKPRKATKNKLKRTHKDVAKTELGHAYKKRSKVSGNEFMDFQCEWGTCNDMFKNVTKFMEHVSEHVVETPVESRGPEGSVVDEEVDDPESKEESRGKFYCCLWRECGHSAPTSSEMVRHIHFHTFHTKLKSHGLFVLEETGIQGCQLDRSERNVLPDLAEPLKCLWHDCVKGGKEWSEPIKFYWHIQWHSEESRGEKECVCQWKDCLIVTKTVSKLKDHLKVHSQEKSVACPCCGGLFSNRTKFFDHCKRQEKASESMKCSYCSKKFSLERLLRDHMRAHINQYKCPMCDMTCPTPARLVMHISYRHFQMRAFECPKKGCSYKAKHSQDLKKHYMIRHEAVTFEYPCLQCDHVARSKVLLKSHINKVHEGGAKRYACHLCDKKFRTGSFLTKHLFAIHKLQWPSGHRRFHYQYDDTQDLYFLKTIRFESLELVERVPEETVDAEPEDDEIMEEITSKIGEGYQVMEISDDFSTQE